MSESDDMPPWCSELASAVATNLELAAELRAWQLKHALQPELTDATN